MYKMPFVFQKTIFHFIRHRLKMVVYILFVFAICTKASIALALTASERADVLKIQNYLNSFKNISSDFIQTDTENEKSTGKFFISKPGLLKWQYLKPDRISILYKNGTTYYVDHELDQISEYSSPDIFMNLMTANKVNLFKKTHNFKLDKVLKSGNFIQLFFKYSKGMKDEIYILSFSFKSGIKLETLQLDNGMFIEFKDVSKNTKIDKDTFNLY